MNIRVVVSDQFSRAIPLTPGSVHSSASPSLSFVASALTSSSFAVLRRRSTKEVTREMCLVYLKKQSDAAKNMLSIYRKDGKSGDLAQEDLGTPSIKHRPGQFTRYPPPLPFRLGLTPRFFAAFRTHLLVYA